MNNIKERMIKHIESINERIDYLNNLFDSCGYGQEESYLSELGELEGDKQLLNMFIEGKL